MGEAPGAFSEDGMKPQVCKNCGKAEWNHKCAGSDDVPSFGSMKDAVGRAEAIKARLRGEAGKPVDVTKPAPIPVTPIPVTPIPVTKKRGRPRKADALSGAERVRKMRERRAALVKEGS